MPPAPWGIALPALKADPAPILPVLERLKLDPEEYVRRSVANNLNDIARTARRSCSTCWDAGANTTPRRCGSS